MSKWESIPLEELAEIRVSNVDKKSRPGEKSVLLCNYMDVYSNEYIDSNLDFMQSTANFVEREKFKVSVGDVIITKDSETPCDIGIPTVVMEEIDELICGYHLALIKPNNEKVDSVYLAKQLASNSVASYFSRRAAGSTRYGLSNGSIRNTAIPLAPREHQTIIASILSTIDQTIEKAEALIHKYQQIKTGLMHDLFTRGLTADGKLRPPREQAPELYQETPIGWIPKEWVLVTIDDLIDGIEQGWSPDCESESADYAEWGVLKTSAVTWDGFVRNQNKRLPKTLLPKLHYQVKADNLLVTRAGPNSRVGVISLVKNDPGKLLISDKLYRLLPKRDVSNEYLELALSSQVTQRYLDGFKTGLAESQTNISQAIIRKLVVVYPNDEERECFIIKLKTINKKISSLKMELEKSILIKQGLMHDLLTGKVSVKLDQAEPAYV